MNEISNHSDIANDLKEQVSKDLLLKVDKFQKSSTGIHVIATKTGVNPKTIRRLMKKENRPNYQTLISLYRYLLATKDLGELLLKAPKVISDEIKSQAGDIAKHSRSETCEKLEQELINDPCALEIYILAGTGEVTEQLISFRFGTFGLDILQKLVSVGAMCETRPGLFVLGEVGPRFGQALIKKAALRLMESYVSNEGGEERGDNFLSFFAEGLSDKGYQEWLRIEEEAFKKKVKLLENPEMLGHKRAFTIQVSDTFTRN